MRVTIQVRCERCHLASQVADVHSDPDEGRVDIPVYVPPKWYRVRMRAETRDSEGQQLRRSVNLLTYDRSDGVLCEECFNRLDEFLRRWRA